MPRMALKPQCGPTKKESDDKADRTGDRHGQPKRHAHCFGQDGTGIATQRQERSMSQRDLPVEARQEVKSEQCRRVNQHSRGLKYVVFAENERKNAEGCEHDCGSQIDDARV